ncbi:MAG TPA: sigma-54 dependent transcriptional regulator [Candidatus Krumholzibacteria bacterium]|nr:sigma-54 dependent transcriptional regulator [Candidatus Krumholzibacteria bacterium]
MTARILIVDDEATIRSSLQESLAADGYDVETAESGEEALARCHNQVFDLVITDLKLPGVSGLEILQALRNQGNETPVIMMTAYGDVDSAIGAMKLGAYDYVKKPFKLGEMKKQVKAALRATPDRREPAADERPARPTAAAAGAADGQYMRMIRSCPGLEKVARLLEKVGSSRSGNDTSILISGESGSGKEIVARAVHEVSQGRGDRFMEINCAAVPETLLESELFGYEKGAFTDAKGRKEGLFELAGGGTIFLDEIGEMGILLQSRLLRVLENRRFRRVGGKDDLEVGARIVAATNRRLGDAIEQGTFRNDLYYRLQVVEIDVPPLRERPDDLRVLIDAFIRDFNGQMGLQTEPVSDELLAMLQKYPWPGNVRELRNVIERIMILEEPRALQAGHFPDHIIEGRNPRHGAAAAGAGQALGLLPLSEVERLQILYTLEKTENNKSKAARLLGISRQTLREKLRLYEQNDGGDDDLLADEAEG